MAQVQIEESWKAQLQGEFEKPYFQQLTAAVRQEYMQTTCYPPGNLIFNAFNLCPFDKVKVVIIGQDPYHEPGQAHGLSFSVQDGVQFPPSLQNIFKEIQNDLAIRLTVIVRWDGRSLPMPPYRHWPRSATIWCTCYGAAMRGRNRI